MRIALGDVPALARRAEALGCEGLIVPEAVSDAIPVALMALEHSRELHVLTGVAVAFARSPMLLAQDAWALQRFSGGRFELGLGSQVRRNVEERFGMPWSAPAPRMRDYVGALRAVFDCWQHGVPLRYESESYTLTRMQPFFAPEPLPEPEFPIPIALGAVGPRMTRVAGEVADAVIAHPTSSTPESLRDAMRPRLAEGARAAGRDPAAIRVIANPMIATGARPEDVAAEREAAREVLAFTYSTRAYAGTLEHLGRAEVGRALRERARAGDWDGMASLVDDALLDVLVPSGPFDEIAGSLRARFAPVADGIALRLPRNPADDDAFARVVEALGKD